LALRKLGSGSILAMPFRVDILWRAPEHDDFCFAYLNERDGFAQTVMTFYYGLSGRIVPLLLLQFPAAIAADIGTGILPAYSVTLAACMVVFLAGTVFAIVRVWPDFPVWSLIFLGLTFAASILGATPSVHDLLYWLPAVACYIPAAIISILLLGECVRALDHESEFSRLATLNMAVGGFIAAMCNEFTAVWLIGVLGSSLLARHHFGQKLQTGRHALIAAAILIGWAIVVSAPGNNARLAAAGGGIDLGFAIRDGLKFALIDLRRFLFSPTILGWLFVVAAVTLAEPEPAKPANPRGRLLALGIAIVCLGCCYFEYFVHQFVTGQRLVERGQNEALILLLFGATLSVSILVRTYRQELRQRFTLGGSPLTLDSVALPAALAALMAASLYMSLTASRMRAERETFYPFWQESFARDRMLTTTQEQIVTVRKHKWTPSVLMNADVTENTGCIAMYYHKSEIKPAEALSQ
jgi:hypothetical protein